jgi:sugar/nucleoside kinase (ribokinase family)
VKRYDVYGIGNALVDMEFEVDGPFLQKNGLEKGLMTLVDRQRQDLLLQAAGGQQHKRSCGGSAANTIIALSQFGGKSFYSCKVAKDETGDFYYRDLLSNGVKTSLEFIPREAGITGKCMVFITPDGERTMETYLGITETFSPECLMEEHLKASAVLYVEGYLVASKTGLEAALAAITMAKNHGVQIALTFSDPSMPKYFRAGVEQLLAKGIDILFANEAEALTYTGASNLSAALEILKKHAKMIVVTQGERGAIVWDGKVEHDILTTPVEALDTNGAGDLFAGAFLYGMLYGHGAAMAGKLACASAGKLVTQFGARLRTEQIQEIKKIFVK